jgi:hypothetical protein
MRLTHFDPLYEEGKSGKRFASAGFEIYEF